MRLYDPAEAARRQYRRAVERHFSEAHRKARSAPDDALKVAQAAALLRWFAASEVVV